MRAITQRPKLSLTRAPVAACGTKVSSPISTTGCRQRGGDEGVDLLRVRGPPQEQHAAGTMRRLGDLGAAGPHAEVLRQRLRGPRHGEVDDSQCLGGPQSGTQRHGEQLRMLLVDADTLQQEIIVGRVARRGRPRQPAQLAQEAELEHDAVSPAGMGQKLIEQ